MVIIVKMTASLVPTKKGNHKSYLTDETLKDDLSNTTEALASIVVTLDHTLFLSLTTETLNLKVSPYPEHLGQSHEPMKCA